MKHNISIIIRLDIVQTDNSWVVGSATKGSRHFRIFVDLFDMLDGVSWLEYVLKKWCQIGYKSIFAQKLF